MTGVRPDPCPARAGDKRQEGGQVPHAKIGQMWEYFQRKDERCASSATLFGGQYFVVLGGAAARLHPSHACDRRKRRVEGWQDRGEETRRWDRCTAQSIGSLFVFSMYVRTHYVGAKTEDLSAQRKVSNLSTCQNQKGWQS